MLSVEGNAALAVVTYIFAATMSWGILMKSTLPFLEKSKCSQEAKLFARDRLKNSHGLSASLPGVIFEGNRAFDQNAEYAMFQELSSERASTQASKICDAYGCLP